MYLVDYIFRKFCAHTPQNLYGLGYFCAAPPSECCLHICARHFQFNLLITIPLISFDRRRCRSRKTLTGRNLSSSDSKYPCYKNKNTSSSHPVGTTKQWWRGKDFSRGVGLQLIVLTYIFTNMSSWQDEHFLYPQLEYKPSLLIIACEMIPWHKGLKFHYLYPIPWASNICH